LPYVLSLIQMH